MHASMGTSPSWLRWWAGGSGQRLCLKENRQALLPHTCLPLLLLPLPSPPSTTHTTTRHTPSIPPETGKWFALPRQGRQGGRGTGHLLWCLAHTHFLHA